MTKEPIVPTFAGLLIEAAGRPPARPSAQAPELEPLAGGAPQDPSNPIEELDKRQQLALFALAAGLGTSGAAKAAEVSRQTIYNWMRQDHFALALRHWRTRTTSAVHDRLLAVADQAAQCVIHSIKCNNANTALSLLKGMGLLRKERTIEKEQTE
jgi:hypothetical protein